MKRSIIFFLMIALISCGESESKNELSSGSGNNSSKNGGENIGKEKEKEKEKEVPKQPEEKEELKGPSLSWVDCHQKHLNKSLDAKQKEECDKFYLKKPKKYKVGMNYFIINTEVSKTFVADGIKESNLAFNQANIEFFSKEVIEIDSVKFAKDKKIKISEILPVFQKLLQVKEEKDVLDKLKEKLKRNWVNPAKIKVDTSLSMSYMFKIIARIYSEEVCVFVHNYFPAGAGGKSGPPSSLALYDSIYAGSVELRPTVKATTLSHELGHYFGLNHTHGAKNYDFSSKYTYRAKTGNLQSSIAQFKKYLGSDFSKPFPNTFLPYNSTEDAIKDQIKFTAPLSTHWVIWPILYKGSYEKLKNFKEFLDIVSTKKEDLYYKNFIKSLKEGETRKKEWYGNNCNFNKLYKYVQCKFGNPAKYFSAKDEALFDGTIVFDKGKNANIMSYFKGYRDDGSAYKTGMFKEQIDMVTSNLRFSARLYLKNYSWE